MEEANLEGGCPLALAVLYELAQKEGSPWYGYLQSLPDTGEDLPMFWSEEEKSWFKGTELEDPVNNDLVNYIKMSRKKNIYSHVYRMISKTIIMN